ncbi:hypothetical protein HOP50_05g36150 [Chloropicon primus]|uniref:Uncharacterized protein n=1 Tax=Chloropicon primus TaxID=1764295 RepID=A0A5B8MKU8_9CHLO|nr:hypothetical protein A3770_05p36050 [Chloropicon primus]UPR00301.1 hypothetical protein HOP50_05g36150 [Chloropicon primus]|mmetsp:Transcript_4515/g.13393  ORF Transcript_4515/g.13393 Transcript_4515/m.13393 type:complete len:296 (+) Transcript_4515:1024-1911(+)|eukprot:QDZ21087.1 hypothetical protein A3770_05p36050 [Chloropicon primus]
MIPPKKRRIDSKNSRIGEVLKEHGHVFSLHPYKFLVSWNGVLVLAFRGFTEKIFSLKLALNECDLFARENPGSMWPKCSLGCLKESRRLSMDQLKLLTKICNDYNSQVFGGTMGDFHEAFKDNPNSMLPVLMPMRVKSLYLTLYECRSHEYVALNEEFVLKEEQPVGENATEEEKAVATKTSKIDRIDPDEKARVEEIYNETLEPNSYWFYASKDGHRESHYRENHLGSSIVAWVKEHLFLSQPTPFSRYKGKTIEWVNTFQLIKDFCASIEEALPDYYTFFDQDSLHVTIRAVT